MVNYGLQILRVLSSFHGLSLAYMYFKWPATFLMCSESTEELSVLSETGFIKLTNIFFSSKNDGNSTLWKKN